MRVLVCGGRDYHDSERVQEVLDGLHQETPFSCVIHGAARGADTLAGLWAKRNAVPVEAYAAAWSRHGRAAGMIRNEQMLHEGRPDLVVAFPGGVGTAGMVRIARQAGVRVEEVRQTTSISLITGTAGPTALSTTASADVPFSPSAGPRPWSTRWPNPVCSIS